MQRLRTMNPEQFAALFRTILQILGAVIGTWGFLTEAQIATLSGPILTLAVTIWGLWARSDANLIASAAAVPAVKAVVAPVDIAASSKFAANDKVVTRMVAMLVVALILPALLSACNETRPSVNVGGTVVVQPSKVDTVIADKVQQVAQYCTLVQVAVGAGDFFVTKPSHQRVLAQAQAAIDQFCLAPPSNVTTALTTLAKIYQAVIAVRNQQT